MAKDRHPVTPAVRALRTAGVAFVPRPYAYVEHGGTARSASELGVDEHCVIKTIVLETETARPVIVLMHGDRQVSTKAMARVLGAKSVRPCDPDAVTKHTGYQVGGTSPFGTRKSIDVYMQETIAALPEILINGGKRGFLVQMSPAAVVAAIAPKLVDVAVG